MTPRRRPATGLPDATVEAIVIRVIARYGSLVLDAAIDEILAEQRAQRLGRRRRLRAVPHPLALATSVPTTGVA